MATAQKKRLRGAQDIRSLSGTRNRLSEPHRGYMRIACLELERFRRNKERECATSRVRSLDARFNEIEAEQAVIFGMLEKERAEPGARRISCPSAGTQKSTFKLKY